MGGQGFRAEFNLTYINMGDRLCAHLKDGDVCSRPSMLYKEFAELWPRCCLFDHSVFLSYRFHW